MSADVLGDVHFVPLTLPPEVTASLKKSGGPGAVESMQAMIAKTNAANKLKAYAAAANQKIKSMNANLKGAVSELPTQAVAVLLGGGAGAYIGYTVYNYLRGYFGAASYAPDIIVPIVGIGIGYAGAQLRDKADAPGGRAPVRAGLLGFGGGVTLMSLARTYQSFVMA